VRRRTRYIIWIVAGILILAPFVLVLSVVYTQFGLRQAIARLPVLERQGVHIEGVTGTLAGPLHIDKFELFNSHVHVLAHDITVDLRVRRLFVQSISATSVKIGDALVEVKESDSPPNDKPTKFLPTFLSLDATSVEVGAAKYVHFNGTTTMSADRAHARLSVTAYSLRVDDIDIQSPDFDVSNADLRLRAKKPMGLTITGAARWHKDKQQYTFNADLDGDLDRMRVKANLLEPAVASADTVYTRKGGAWNIDGDVRSNAFDLSAWLEHPPFRLENVALQVHATAAEVHAKGTVRVPEVDPGDLNIDARGAFAEHVLTIASANVEVQKSSARAHAAGTITLGEGSPLIDAAADWSQLRWPLHGDVVVQSPTGTIKLLGRMPYDFTVNAAVTGPRIPDAQGVATGMVSKTSLELASYDIAALGGNVSGSGSLGFAKPTAWVLVANGTQLDPASLYAPLAGRIDFAVEGNGSGLSKNAQFKLAAKKIDGLLHNQRLLAHGGLDRDSRGWAAHGLDIDWGATHAKLDGEWRDGIRGSWSVNSTALSQLVPGLEGKVQSAGTASGTREQPHIKATLNAQSLSYAGWTAARIDAETDVDISDRAPSSFSIRAQQLLRAGFAIDAIRLDGKGTSATHRLDLQLAQLTVSGETAVSTADIWFDGKYANRRWQSTFDTEAAPQVSSTGILSSTGYVAMTHPAHAVIAQDELSVDQLCLVVGDGQMCAHVDWKRDGPYSARVSASSVPLAALDTNPRDNVKYDGRLEGEVEIRGNGKQPVIGNAHISVMDAAIIYPLSRGKTDTLELGSGRFDATADPEKIAATLDLKALSQTTVQGEAHLTRQDSFDFMHYPLEAKLEGKTADANMLPLLFPDVDRAAGTLTASLNATGTLAAPELNGDLRLEHGELDAYQVNLALRDLDLDARLSSNTINFSGTGRAGEGTFKAGGQLAWQQRAPVGEIHFSGQNLLVADLADYRVHASPELDFKIDNQQLTVTGNVLIPMARLQPANLSNAVRISPDARYTDETSDERSGKLRVDSSVTIKLGDDVRVDSFGLQGQLHGSVGTSVKTGQVATGRGELNVSEGRYEAYGQKLDIARGRLLFDASPIDDPGLDIQAERKIESTTVGLNVRGTLRDPRLSFFSDPTMSQMQIVSYLVTGKPVEDLQGSDAGAVRNAQNSLAVSGGGFLASQLGRRLGLEEVGVETDANARSSLVLGKFLSPRMFVSYGISLTESINTLKLRYTISDRWTLKTEAGEANAADVEYTIER
jgi:translocation and assembly module TamB